MFCSPKVTYKSKYIVNFVFSDKITTKIPIMLKLIHDTLPQGYAVCLHNDCPLAQTCLHQLAYNPLLETQEELRMINPSRCSKEQTCKFYRSNKPLRYARGFASFQPKMLPRQWSSFVSILREEWGRTRFYERRRGDIAMPPAEQEFVLDALKQSGVIEIFEFDKYEDLLTWYD